MPLGRVTSPRIINETLTTQDTEYPVALPPQTVRIRVQARAADVRLSFQPGRSVAGPFMTVKAAQRPFEVDDVVGIRELFLASGTGGAVVEIICWT